MMTDKIIYSDIRQKEPYKQPLLYNEKAIHQSILNILSTSPGERLFLPDFGVGLRKYLFRFPTRDTEQDLMDRIISQVTKWETRVKIIEKRSSIVFDEDEKAFKIKLVYDAPALGLSNYTMLVLAPLEL